MSALRPLLGFRANSIYDIRLPCYASYKLDGWRGIWQGLEFFSRHGKTIPNRALQRLTREHNVPPGWDGEVIVGEPNASNVFSVTDSFCKTASKPVPAAGVRLFVFDNALDPRPYADRYQSLTDIGLFVVRLDQHLVERYDELEEIEAEAVGKGYEGICARTPLGRYKGGRSTLREQYLIKLKRYIDEEVRIIGFEELFRNANPAFESELGYTKRTSHKEGKIPAGTLGSVIVDWRGKELRVGTGFDTVTRDNIWRNQSEYLGKLATIKYSPAVKDLPRQPVWKGLRND